MLRTTTTFHEVCAVFRLSVSSEFRGSIFQTVSDEDDDDDADDYASHQDELIRRAPIQNEMNDGTFTFDPVYMADREKVWELIDKLTRDHYSHTYVSPASKTRDWLFLDCVQHFNNCFFMVDYPRSPRVTISKDDMRIV